MKKYFHTVEAAIDHYLASCPADKEGVAFLILTKSGPEFRIYGSPSKSATMRRLMDSFRWVAIDATKIEDEREVTAGDISSNTVDWLLRESQP